MIAFRSPNRSPSIPNTGCATPQARFWMAMARLKSDLGQWNVSAMGNWKTPKLPRTAKFRIRIRQPAIRTGVNRVRVIAERCPAHGPGSNADR